MKKIIGAAAALAAVGVVAVAPAQAATSQGAFDTGVQQGNTPQLTTSYEQTLLTNMNNGVTINLPNGGDKHYGPDATPALWSAYDRTISYLYANAYTDAQIDELNDIVNTGRNLIIRNVDSALLEKTGSLSQSIPAGTMAELLALATRAENILASGRGPAIQDGTSLTDAEKETIKNCKDGKATAATTGSVVKTTGADYTANLAVFAGLVVASVGVAFVGKKYSTKIGLF